MAKTLITGDVFSYNKAVEFIVAHASKTGIDTPLVTKMKLFCQEIILNIIKHAYDGVGGDIGIEFEVKNNEIVIGITDNGNPYNSLGKKEITSKGPKKPSTAVSDFGKLMAGVFDSAEYVRVGDSNVVTLRKNLTR
jgi:anti-sigma regulatory factor (Ser/Thr protein kinase)